MELLAYSLQAFSRLLGWSSACVFAEMAVFVSHLLILLHIYLHIIPYPTDVKCNYNGNNIIKPEEVPVGSCCEVFLPNS